MLDVLPTFIVGGSPRSGTTWTHALLKRHPEVYMAEPEEPEPKFFHVDRLYEQGLAYYRDTWFCGDGVRAAKARGEKTTYYLENPIAAERIARDLPGVRMIFLLREPAARAYSNFLRSAAFGFETESFERALALEETRERDLPERLRFIRPHAYASRGMYADLLEPYVRLFGMERLLCVRFEDIAADPGGVASRLHRFIGVTPRPEDGVALGRVNEAKPVEGGRPPPPPLDVMQALKARFTEPNRRLAALLGPEFAWS